MDTFQIIIIIAACIGLFLLYRIYRKVAELDDDFNGWYSDWQKKFDKYDPPQY